MQWPGFTARHYRMPTCHRSCKTSLPQCAQDCVFLISGFICILLHLLRSLLQDNVQILRDLALLQIQMRDIEGYRVRRRFFLHSLSSSEATCNSWLCLPSMTAERNAHKMQPKAFGIWHKMHGQLHRTFNFLAKIMILRKR